jgi:hypothetical protein
LVFTWDGWESIGRNARMLAGDHFDVAYRHKSEFSSITFSINRPSPATPTLQFRSFTK